MKASIVALFCTAAIFAFLEPCSADYNPFIFQLGARPFADKLFDREEIKKNSAGPYRKVSEIKTFVTDGKARITHIRATDLKKNGATVRLLSGGPGQTFATLEFTSAPAQGFHYMFEMYAKY